MVKFGSVLELISDIIIDSISQYVTEFVKRGLITRIQFFIFRGM